VAREQRYLYILQPSARSLTIQLAGPVIHFQLTRAEHVGGSQCLSASLLRLGRVSVAIQRGVEIVSKAGRTGESGVQVSRAHG